MFKLYSLKAFKILLVLLYEVNILPVYPGDNLESYVVTVTVTH